MKTRLTGLVSLAILAGAFLVIRYPLLPLHGMKEWPVDLFAVGAVVIAVSGILLDAKWLPAFAAIGYIAGFIVGCGMQWDYAPGANNLWIIWTGVFAVFLLAGAVAEFLAYRNRKKDPPQ